MVCSARCIALLAPLVVGAVAWWTDWLPLKLGVPALCICILLSVKGEAFRRAPSALLACGAFAASIVGDYYLSTRGGSDAHFVAGIAAFGVAHLFYIAYALANGRMHLPVLGIALAGFGAWFALDLAHAIEDRAIWVAALVYTVLSCVALGAAAGIRSVAWVKVPCLVGIALIVFSDSLIALAEFAGDRTLSELILPTYYLAQIAITLSALHLLERGRSDAH
ncbi:MAG TPA: lysoplasmalogenase family protein [Chthonomonadales bacterium]|nr:lysoplasmalogenase family protein [Chthonomonadales bacterium]